MILLKLQHTKVVGAEVDNPDDDHLTAEFPLQLVQFAACLSLAKLGPKPLRVELPLLEPLAQVGPQLVEGYLPY